MDIKGKKALVVGFGITGEAVCRFLLSQGAQITVSEKKQREELGPHIQTWIDQGIEFETGGHLPASFLDADLIIPSPGVPPFSALLAAQDKGIPILSEVELAHRFLKGRIIGITGSNGKSTVATLTHKILSEAGLRVNLAGNIGTPLIRFVEESSGDKIYVTELSSFQLQFTEQFCPYISVLLNISYDHLDWHTDFEDYVAAKTKIVRNQGAEEIAILNRDDARIWKLSDQAPFQIYSFSRQFMSSPGSYIHQDQIIFTSPKSENLMSVQEVPLLGEHNLENVLAAALVAHILKIPSGGIRKSIQSFKGLEHRLEKVMELEGVIFYNDSKATNVDSTLKSIHSFSQPIILIMGGRDKGGDFHILKEAIKSHVKRIILLGEAKEKIRSILQESAPIDIAASLSEAVMLSFSRSHSGDVVLLAPGCTSFDMFRSYAHRGKEFKREVLAFAKEYEERNA